MLIEEVLIGSDIETFIQNQNNIIETAEPYVQGTKHNPFNFDETDKFALTSLDNVLFEFCIAPSNECSIFVAGINKAQNYIQSVLPDGYSMATIPSAILDRTQLMSRAAKMFGCESDLNAWLRQTNPTPKASNTCLRSAGFHTHVGYKDPKIAISEMCIKAMDVFLSVPSVLAIPSKLEEAEHMRRELYGRAGAFREKPYGFEHRVLSGYFASSDQLKAWVFNNTMAAIRFVNENENVDEFDAIDDMIQDAINNGNKVAAGNIIRQFQIEMP